MKPQDLDDHAPVEPDGELLANIRTRSRSFRRRRTMQRLTGVTAGLLVVALAGGIAWTRVDTTDNRQITLPAATSTTLSSGPALTQNAVMGKWRPVSITGYFVGPRNKAYISFDGRGSWSASDGCDETTGAYRIERTGIHLEAGRVTTQNVCRLDTYPDLGPILGAAKIELRNDQLMFLTSDGKEIARFVRAVVTARIELPSTTMTAGSTMTAHVVVENDTGHDVRATGCGSLFGVGLRNAHIPQDVIFPLCAEEFTIPVGESSYPVPVLAEYYACDAAGDQGLPRCLPDGTPPLPPGVYQATLYQASPVVPAPPPIDVTVTAR
ncbi:MAG TPA: META domain-containing protein [Acidimicrobiia bacterium]|nr:META domain-containing protein [Acidimicrobiia bacterium]